MSHETEKTLDNLGRVILPVKYRNQLGLKPGDKVLISLKNDAISITPSTDTCALCGKALVSKCELRLCKYCIQAVKNHK
ncbi:MAG: AbrB/MazE/SpoVT family DNA-binding domain-containing protein [Clostridia bacterium]|nr:AbrB/MazE/SpoVT family DNA-binding domain-containing protein [Clostridia bacterium]